MNLKIVILFCSQGNCIKQPTPWKVVWVSAKKDIIVLFERTVYYIGRTPDHERILKLNWSLAFSYSVQILHIGDAKNMARHLNFTSQHFFSSSQVSLEKGFASN